MSIAPPRERPERNLPLDPFLDETESSLELSAAAYPGEESLAGAGKLGKALRSPAAVVTALATIAAVWALVVSLVVFPNLSDNNDEATYLIQAEALRNGHLFPPAPQNWESFLPSLSVWKDGHFVPKYTPVHAGIIALGDALFGSQRAALGLIAALGVTTCYLLAREVLPTRRQARVGAIFYALSPLVLIQSATFLSYLSALVLLQGFAATLLAGTRKESRPMKFLAGALAGTAFFARPYDAALFGGPFVLWLIWHHRKAARKLFVSGLWLGLGAVVPIGMMFAYFYSATGGWFDTPFNLTHPSDMLGFGRRQMYPGSKAISYTPALGWEGMSSHLKLIGFWCFGGLGLIALSAAGLRRSSWSNPLRWCALIVFAVPVGYFFFWGSVGSIRWGAPSRLGPFYYLPMITPLAILGAAGFDRLWKKTRKVAALAAVAMMLMGMATIANAFDYNRDYTQKRKDLYGPLLTGSLNNALVFLPQLAERPLLTHPFAMARNSSDFSGDVVWALDRGPEANRRVMAEFPQRVPFRLVTVEKPEQKNRSRFTLDFTTELERVPSSLKPGLVLAED